MPDHLLDRQRCGQTLFVSLNRSQCILEKLPGHTNNMDRQGFAEMVRHVCLLLMFAALLPVTRCLHAQQSSIVKLTVEKKPGALDGRAMATVKGPAKVKGRVVITEKTGRIATQAIQAWIVLDGQGALLLLSPEKKGLPNRLRYYELDAGKGRLLGRVPLEEATIAERKPANEQWAFALSGSDPVSKQPVIFAGDTHAIHARIDGASQPQFSADSLSYQTPVGRHPHCRVGHTTRCLQYSIELPPAAVPVASLHLRWTGFPIALPLQCSPEEAEWLFSTWTDQHRSGEGGIRFRQRSPLNGGGIFQLGVQYGGGIKYRVLPRLTM
jgi:hypothetical protein